VGASLFFWRVIQLIHKMKALSLYAVFLPALAVALSLAVAEALPGQMWVATRVRSRGRGGDHFAARLMWVLQVEAPRPTAGAGSALDADHVLTSGGPSPPLDLFDRPTDPAWAGAPRSCRPGVTPTLEGGSVPSGLEFEPRLARPAKRRRTHSQDTLRLKGGAQPKFARFSQIDRDRLIRGACAGGIPLCALCYPVPYPFW